MSYGHTILKIFHPCIFLIIYSQRVTNFPQGIGCPFSLPASGVGAGDPNSAKSFQTKGAYGLRYKYTCNCSCQITMDSNIRHKVLRVKVLANYFSLPEKLHRHDSAWDWCTLNNTPFHKWMNMTENMMEVIKGINDNKICHLKLGFHIPVYLLGGLSPNVAVSGTVNHLYIW